MYPAYDATDRYEMVEQQIAANSTQTRFNFNDQPQLRTDQTQDVIIQGLETYTITDIPLSPNAVALPTAVQLKATYLVLYVNGEESIYRIPLVKLHTINNFADAFNNGEADTPRFENLLVDWTKSYLFTPAAYGGGVFATFSFLIGVVYKKLPPSTIGKIRQNQYVSFMNIKLLALNTQ
jgi:hypothetical protein